jgi:two-component sensor histidine kinase
LTLVPPAVLLITSELYRRPTHAPDLAAEAQAFYELSRLIVVDPAEAVRRFVELARALCRAGSAGLSLLVDGEEGFRWSRVTGGLSLEEGRATPRDSVGGLCLQEGSTILIRDPGRAFRYYAAEPPIAEILAMPLYDSDRTALGVIWLASHSEDRRFDAEDARVLGQLGVQLVLAVKTLQAGHDASQLVQRAEHAERAAEQTQVLLREINHRVKNTLQTAGALLQLQMGEVGLDARGALTQAYGRLSALARVHELLYSASSDEQTVDMRALLAHVSDSMADLEGRVRVRVSADPLSLPPADAVPLALIANELLTNAVKHAFPDGRRGRVDIALTRAADGTLSLSVSDNGVGLSGRPRDGSFGLKLVAGMAEQVGGEVIYGGEPGKGVTVGVRVPSAAAGPVTA